MGVTKEPNGGRLDWPDALRGIAIYAVCLAHLGSMSAYISLYCFGFVIQLFFFVSGLFASVYGKLTVKELALRLFNRLVVPYVFLCVLSIAFYLLVFGGNAGEYALQCLLAVRNKMFAPTLWFFPCLVVMTAVYYFLSRLIKNRAALLAVCLLLSLAVRLFKETSQWFWSADSALMFLFYYALGDAAMPRLTSLKTLSSGKKLAAAAALLLSAAVAGLAYFVYTPTETKPFGIASSETSLKLFTFFAAVAFIALLTALSMLLQKSKALQSIGQNAMVIASTTSITSWLFFELCWLLGIEWVVRRDWQTLFYGAALTLFANYCVAVPLKKLFPFIFSRRKKTN